MNLPIPQANAARTAFRTMMRAAGFPLAMLFLGASFLPAQKPDAAAKQQAVQAKVAALKESLAKNKAALLKYTWTETTEISLKGEVKKTVQKVCSYGPDGKVQKTELAGAPPPPPAPPPTDRKGKLKKKVVANKVDDMKDYMEKATELIQQYVPPDPAKIQEAVKAGNAAVQPSATGTSLAFKNYVKPKDQMTIGLDTAITKIQSVNIASYLEKESDAVTLAVTFDGLPDGTNYSKETVLTAKAKNITVKITNSKYGTTAK